METVSPNYLSDRSHDSRSVSNNSPRFHRVRYQINSQQLEYLQQKQVVLLQALGEKKIEIKT